MGPKPETVSTRPKPCGKAEFTCSNRKCIPAQLQCDLFDDCGDGGSDEQDCKACMCLPNLSDTSVGKQAILSDLRQSWWITWTHAVHLELSFENHSGLSSKWVFFFFLVHILFVANDQASKHKKIPSCTGMVGCKYKVCHFKAVSHSSFKWRHMWKEDESLWRGCSVQSYKHKCNLPLQTWLSEKSQKQKVWRYCQTIFPDSVSVQKNDSLLYLRGDVDLDFQCKGVVCNFCDIKQNCNLFVWVILCLTTLAEPGSEINGFKMPQKIKLENPCNDEFLYFWYIWYINVIYFTIFCVRPT